MAIECTLLISVMAGCIQGPRVIMAPGYENTQNAINEENTGALIAVPTKILPTPTFVPSPLNEVRYVIPSQAFSFYPLKGWNLEEEKTYYAKFVSAEGSAWFEAAYESTGYTLDPEVFTNYTDNIIASLYIDSGGFQIVDHTFQGNERIYTTKYIINGTTWYAFDTFIQRGAVAYLFSFHAVEALWEPLFPKFIEVFESAETHTGYVSDDRLFEFNRNYYDPDNVFRLRKPIGWKVTGVEIIGESTRKQSIVSPDGSAEVQVVIYSADEAINSQNIGQTANALLKDLIADDIVFTKDDVLYDGRIRLDWTSRSTGMTGFSFFWLNGEELYLLTFMQDNQHSGIYQRTNYRIGDTFKFLAEK